MYHIDTHHARPRHEKPKRLFKKIALITIALMSGYILSSCTSTQSEEPPSIAVPAVFTPVSTEDILPINHYEYHSSENKIAKPDGIYTQDGKPCTEIMQAPDEKEAYYKLACKLIDGMAAVFTVDESTYKRMNFFIQGLKILDLEVIRSICAGPDATGCTALGNTYLAQEHFTTLEDVHTMSVLSHELAHDIQNQDTNPDISLLTSQYRVDKNKDGLFISDQTGTTLILNDIFPTLTQAIAIYILNGGLVPTGDIPYVQNNDEAYKLITDAKSMVTKSLLDGETNRQYLLNPFLTEESLKSYLENLGNGDINSGLDKILGYNKMFSN